MSSGGLDTPSPVQQKESEWTWQWNKTTDDAAWAWLFEEWIEPNTWDTFKDRDALELGCGPGHHIALTSRVCRHVTGLDLNAIESAQTHVGHLRNVSLVEGDIAAVDLGRTFDVVYAIGVLHHTDDPDASFENARRHCRPGGRMIVWVYSHEGNYLNRAVLEPVKRVLVRYLPRPVVWELARALTALLTIPIYTLYRLPIPGLPFKEYFDNWRRMSFSRNMLNVFDKLNAPQTFFLRREDMERWFSAERFTDVHISPYKGVSWRASGTRRPDPAPAAPAAAPR